MGGSTDDPLADSHDLVRPAGVDAVGAGAVFTRDLPDAGIDAEALQAAADEVTGEMARRAEIEIEGAPMRLLFPMLVFLFPPILVLVLYPPAARLIEQLTGAGPGGLGF